MELILFRHGPAEDRAKDGTDASRALTADGIKKTTQASLGLARLIKSPATILSSPKMRAAQTAAILGEAMEVDPEAFEALAGDSLEGLLAALWKRRDQRVVLVGHEPLLGRTIQRLCTGAGVEAVPTITLKKAGAAALDLEVKKGAFSHGTLAWLATPRMLRKLGE
jgi:phosphohistidine phosphatase